MQISGELTTYLDALGMRPDDPRLEPVLDLPGPTTDTNEESDGTGVVFHLAARSSGTEFVFADEQLMIVFIGTQERENWGVYPRPDALIDGLSGTATRPEVRAALGDPSGNGTTRTAISSTVATCSSSIARAASASSSSRSATRTRSA